MPNEPFWNRCCPRSYRRRSGHVRFPCFTHCTPATVADDVGWIAMLTRNSASCQAKPVPLPKTTMLRHHGYHIDTLIAALEPVEPQSMTQICFELATKPSQQAKAAPGKAGVVPVAARWVMERSNAWMARCKSLVKNFERTLAHATTKRNLCVVRLMLKRQAATS